MEQVGARSSVRASLWSLFLKSIINDQVYNAFKWPKHQLPDYASESSSSYFYSQKELLDVIDSTMRDINTVQMKVKVTAKEQFQLKHI